MSRYIGVDPGAKGSLCLLDSTTKDITFFDIAGQLTLPYVLHKWIDSLYRERPIQMIAIEDVHSIFGMSAKSNFSFGVNVGMLQAILDISQIGFEKVQPKVWQKACGIVFKKGMKPMDRKKLVASTALQLYPKANIHGPKGGLLDGRSDALMIAHYLSIKYGTLNNGSKT